jgi:hypothetical protein
MIIIRFESRETELQALDVLVGKFPFKTWSSGELMVPADALPHLAIEGIRFRVEGPATYEHNVPAVRDPAAASV